MNRRLKQFLLFLAVVVLLSCKLVSTPLTERDLVETNIAMSFTLIASAEQYHYDLASTPLPKNKPKKKTPHPKTPTSAPLESVKTQSGEQPTNTAATPRPTRTPRP